MTEPKPGYVQPLSTGGIGALLISLCGAAPKEYQDTLILISTFASPFIVAGGLKLTAIFNVPAELIQYKATLKRDFKAIKEELASEQLTDADRAELSELAQRTRMLLLTAHQDYYGGKLKIGRVAQSPEQTAAGRPDA